MRSVGSILIIGCVLLVGYFVAGPADAQDPCAEPKERALVLGGGGSKGAFQAGAVYHLIVDRGCDFAEISGTSSGALIGALLAQAEVASESEQSLDSLEREAEAVVALWTSVRRTKDLMKSRPLAILRVGLFGLESMKNFEPLRELLGERIALERLASGRALRVGTTSFADGHYREIVINPGGHVDPLTAFDVLLGSAMVPVFGELPRIAVAEGGRPEEAVQYADGGLRHSTPVTSYFRSCGVREESDSEPTSACMPFPGDGTPPHGRIEQLFIVVTSPYARRSDWRPPMDPKAFKRGTRQIRDGRKILVRSYDLLVDTIYREDLDEMLMLNDLVAWRAREATRIGAIPFFPVESYNRDEAAPDSVSQPYEIAIVVPEREDTDPMTMFEFEPQTIARQLYCGCLAADGMMQTRFGSESMATGCAERFPRPPEKRGKKAEYREGSDWEAGICRDERTAPAEILR